ncbi:hypothetical protein HanRHA438_Chr07g0290651 [Helianthus annuus]|nr:hypothetical protein HanRHA438_Chr07g0290651 [Helianthus annuus]
MMSPVVASTSNTSRSELVFKTLLKKGLESGVSMVQNFILGCNNIDLSIRLC